MSNKSFLICKYYFGLPEFPNICKIVKNNSLLLRDVLCSFRGNSHINWGGQYDPHYEFGKGPQLKKCHLDARNKIKKISDSKDYDDIYLLFMTNHQFLDKTNKILISGFYEVDQQNIEINKDYDDPVLYAKRAVFINLSDCVDISSLAIGKGLVRFGFSSETNGGIYHNYLLNIKDEIERKSNILELYKKETVKLDKLFKYFEYEEGMYDTCEGCDSLKICPLVKRIKSKNKLYNKLPIKISNIINEYYKSVIDTKGLI